MYPPPLAERKILSVGCLGGHMGPRGGGVREDTLDTPFFFFTQTGIYVWKGCKFKQYMS